MDLLTDNFQPLWMQCLVVGIIVGAFVSLVILLWVTFWEWRDKRLQAVLEDIIRLYMPLGNKLNPQEMANFEELGRKLKQEQQPWIPLHKRRKS